MAPRSAVDCRAPHLSEVADAVMWKARLILSLTMLAVSMQAFAVDDDETSQFRLLFLLFLSVFSAIVLLSSMPRSFRRDIVTADILQSFAQAKGLTPERVTIALEERLHWREKLRRWRSTNPAVKHPEEDSIAFRGSRDGLQFAIDEVSIRPQLGNAWRRERYLRVSVALPEAPTALQVLPARLGQRLTGRAGLLRKRPGAPSTGRLTAKFSQRPLVRAKERMFLNDARRQLLEDYQAKAGDIYINDGNLHLIWPRFDVTGPELDRLYADADALARGLIRA